MPKEIKRKYGASAALTITLAALPTSVAGVGQQSTLVDNSVTRYGLIHVWYKVTTGTTPTTAKTIQFYLLKDDGTGVATDGAGASDAAITIIAAPLVHAVGTDATSDKAYRGHFVIRDPGTKWGIAVVHDTAVNLNATGGNHAIKWLGDNPEVQ